MRRPDVFTLDYSHPLAQGLVLAGLTSPVHGFVDYSLLANKQVSGVVAKGAGPSGGIDSYIVPTGNSNPIALATASDAYRITTEVPLACAFWGIFPYTSESANSEVISHGVFDSSAGGWAGWDFGYGRETTTYYRRRVGFRSGLRQAFQIGYFPENTWHHYYLESSASGWVIYTDGYLNNSGTSGIHANTTLSYAPVLFKSGVSSRISDVLLFRRSLSPAEIAILADRTDPMLGGLVREVNPVAYFDFGGASAGTDNLTATDLVTGSPVLGTPALGQVHALTATGITTSAPVLGSPALGQVHGLAATALTVSAPVLGTPAVGQAHSLVASALVVGSPILGTPTLTENAADVDALTADNLVVGSPVLGTPAIGQIHVLGSDGLVTGSPALGSPSVTQIHTLEALGLTVGVPVLGTPMLFDLEYMLQTRAELKSLGTTDFTSPLYGATHIELRCYGNYEVNEFGE